MSKSSIVAVMALLLAGIADHCRADDGMFLLKAGIGLACEGEFWREEFYFNEKCESGPREILLRQCFTGDVRIGIEYAKRHQTYCDIGLEYSRDRHFTPFDLPNRLGIGHSYLFTVRDDRVSVDFIVALPAEPRPGQTRSISYEILTVGVTGVSAMLCLNWHFGAKTSLGLDIGYHQLQWKCGYVGYPKTYDDIRVNNCRIGISISRKYY